MSREAYPHIGHIYTAVLADATHRWTLLKAGKDADLSNFKLTTGVDEHGAKIQSAASSAGLQTQQFVDQNAAKFQQVFQKFGILNTDFIRTTDDKHKKAVASLWNILKSNGYIEKANYEGWYSTIDECFYTDKDVEKVNGNIMIAKETKNPVEWFKEDNYVFDIGKFYKPLKDWLNSGVICPDNFLPMALSSLRQDEKLSISRDSKRVKWGITVPDDPSQTIYVWLDALTNYLTAVGYPDDTNTKLWPPDVQIIGKDILKFHAIYWPAFLMAAKLPLPKKLFVHSHWLVNGRKMSKSYGNVLDPYELAEILTTEGLRYFLLRQGTPQDDSNITISKAIDLINSELVNALGNLLSRSTVQKLNPNQIYPTFYDEVLKSKLKEDGQQIVDGLNSLAENVTKCFDELYFYRGLEFIFEQIRNTNALLEIHRPWNMTEGPELSTILFISYETIRIANILLQPLVPEYSNKALTRLGLSENERSLDTAKFDGGECLKLAGRKLGENYGNLMARIQVKDSDSIIKKKKSLKKSAQNVAN
uniref:Methionine--tRNA ligase, mitochondrial n=1 Tax=Panagrolaimus sp. ES5 TaxID=591445 RepID=A0AC34FG83_9BILA